jgi:multiple sugar transport system substrate-binding protein
VLGASAAIALGTSGIASAAARVVTTVNFWSWDPGMAQVVAVYNRTHPSVHVALTSISPEYPKLLAALTAGNPPDAAQVEYEALPEFIATGALVNLAPAGFAQYKADFVPWAWQQVHEGLAMYAVPQDAGPMLMFYRKDIFAKYGLAVPKTWGQFASEAASLHREDPAEYMGDFAGASDPSWFLGLMWQNGAKWFGVRGQEWTVSIDSTASVKVSSYWQDLIDRHLVGTENDFTPAFNEGLASGTIATVVQGGWFADLLEGQMPQTAGDWSVALPPQWGASRPSDGNSGGSADVIFNGSEHKAQAEAFLSWLNCSDQGWSLLYSDVHLVPTYDPAYKLPALNAKLSFFSNTEVGSLLQQASRQVNEDFAWAPTTETVFTDAADDDAAVLSGHGTLTGALKTLQAQAVASLKSGGYPVAG